MRFILSIFLVFIVSLIGSAKNVFTIVNQTDSSLTIHFTLPQYGFTQKQIDSIVYQTIEAANSQTIAFKSSPELPKYSTSILIPNNANLSFSIIDSSFSEYSNIRIIPSTGSLKRIPLSSDYKEGKQYSINEFYPSVNISTGLQYQINNNKGTSIALMPFRYNPVSKKLVVITEMTINIAYGSTLHIQSQNTYNNDFENTTLNHFLNYKKSRLKSDLVSYIPSSMLVLCPNKYMQAIKSFVAWKNQKGIRTEVLMSDSLKSSSDIKNIITNYYTKNKNSYVLFVGDTIAIPQMQRFEISDNAFIASDNAYGDIIGNDSYPEVIIGRMSAHSVQDITIQTQRIIQYEKRISNDSSISKYLMVASAQGPGYNDLYDYQLLHNITDNLKTFDYTSGDELYDGSQGGADSTGNPTSLQLTTSINAGKGLFFYTGHSSGNMLVTSSFASSDAKNFTNTNSFPFGVIAGCKAGQLNNDTCIAEACLWAQTNSKPTGLVTMLASTIDQWWNPPMAGQEEFVASLIHENTIDSIPTFGLLALKSFLFMNDNFQNEGFETTDSWSIFGDPTLQIFTKKSDSLSVNFDKNIVLGQDTLTVFSSNENAWICVSMNNKILNISKINGGRAFMQFPSIADTGTVIVTAYGFNHKPYIDSTKIITPKNDFLVISDFTAKSKNSIIQNGDSILIALKIKNIGQSNASGYSISATTNDTTFSIIQSMATIKSLNANTEIDMGNVFTATVKVNAPDQSIANVSITFTNALNQSYTIVKTFIINAASLCYTGKIITDISGSNNNIVAEPGEIVAIDIIIQNTGNASADISNCILQSPSNAIFSYVKEIKNKTIAPGSSDTIVFITSFAGSIQSGNTIPLDFSCRFNQRLFQMRDYVKIGQIMETWENDLMNNFQWTNNTATHWFVSDSEAYNSKYSLQSGRITDSESTTVSLSITLPHADSISFMAKTSCETPIYLTDHFVYYDYLDFRIDGTTVYKQAGLTEWKKVSLAVSSGFHTLSWTYLKDESNSEGMDDVWIDNIILPYFVQNSQQVLLITSTPVIETSVKALYSYTISTNLDPSATISLFKAPAWLTLQNNILSGISPTEGIDTIIISATANNQFANQIIILTSKKIESTVLNAESTIYIYPNPVTSILYITGNDEFKYYSITDCIGRIIQSGTIINNTISTLSLPSNVYYLKVWNSNRIYNQTFIKIE